jgi:hypothetical protein
MDKLTTDKARVIFDALQPTSGYLFRLVERMDRTNLRRGDPELYRLVRAAESAKRSLRAELHYQSCKHGVGRPSGEGEPTVSPPADEAAGRPGP